MSIMVKVTIDKDGVPVQQEIFELGNHETDYGLTPLIVAQDERGAILFHGWKFQASMDYHPTRHDG